MHDYPTPPYISVNTLSDANRYLSTILPGDVIGFDLEWIQPPNRTGKLTPSMKKAKLREEVLHVSTFSIDWPNVPVCLAQIATLNNPVYLIHIRDIGGMFSLTLPPPILIHAQRYPLSSSASARAVIS